MRKSRTQTGLYIFEDLDIYAPKAEHDDGAKGPFKFATDEHETHERHRRRRERKDPQVARYERFSCRRMLYLFTISS
jgi:hypothetical protein